MSNRATRELKRKLVWDKRCSNEFSVPVFSHGRSRRERDGISGHYPVHTYLTSLKEELSAILRTSFVQLQVNMYRGMWDSLGWHSDMDLIDQVAIVSLGSSREIRFRRNGCDGECGLVLENGSLLTMGSGMQDDWEHCVPASTDQRGERVSIVFRSFNLNQTLLLRGCEFLVKEE